MNELRKAAEMALEALESKLGETHPFAHSLENAAARRALREALAEQPAGDRAMSQKLLNNADAQTAYTYAGANGPRSGPVE